MTLSPIQRRLIARGLLTEDLKVTPAGERYTDEIIEKLKGQTGTIAAPAKRVAWSYSR